jgi:hypothetical protein
MLRSNRASERFMTSTDKLVQLARGLIEDAGRPLNARRLFAMGRDQGIWPEGVAISDLQAALDDAPPESGIGMVRKGVFGRTDAEPVSPVEPAAKVQPELVVDEDEPMGMDRDSDRGSDRRGRGGDRKRRRVRTADLLGGTPAAPISIDEAMKAARRADRDTSSLRRTLWTRIQAQAAAVVGEGGDGPAIERPAPSAPPGAIAPVIFEPDVAPMVDVAPAQASVLEAAVEPEAASPAPAPAARVVEADLEPERPYVQERSPAVPHDGADRRQPVLKAIASTSEVVALAIDSLRAAEGPLTLPALAETIEAKGYQAASLRAVVRAENARLVEAGLRPVFEVQYDGQVDLVERSLSSTYLSLEAKLHESIAEQHELVRRDLLARVGSLSFEGFERIVRLVYERAGYTDLSVVMRRGQSLLLTATRQPSRQVVVVLARQVWSATGATTVNTVRGGLKAFGAEAAMLVTLGTFTEDARETAAESGAPVELIDGEGFARALWRHGVGLAAHRPTLRFVDGAFFSGLS